ncbi:SDR family oxidoreductase [Litchfieldia alkalitelluris]|uniref:SDR family oxidoreductase n=1 Tax=Litchfieldia alkalitelluris TaxID=304268 RepID=UPI0009960A4C|nr:SDR family oxidoreductase [Litchfieldia alkalitelluris]
MSKSKILVTGATGNIGKYVVEELINRNEKVLAAAFTERQSEEKVEWVSFDFTNPTTFDSALEEVDRVFLIRPPQLAKPQKDMKPFLLKVKEKGIRHIVFVSLMGVERNRVVPHRKIEDLIKELEIPYTFLRPSFFMQNLNTTHRDDIKLRDELYMPVGKARTSFIDTRDIASVASICLTEEDHLNKAYTLTGSEALDYYEVSNILTNVLGRTITYRNPGFFEFRRTIIKRGTRKDFANVMTMLYAITKMGTAEKVTEETQNLLNREPIKFEEYAKDFKHHWM